MLQGARQQKSLSEELRLKTVKEELNESNTEPDMGRGAQVQETDEERE